MSAVRMHDRNAMLAKLHVAKKQLGLSDEAYRDVLARVTKSVSAKNLMPAELDAVLLEFRRLGFKAPPPRRGLSKHAQIRMIYGVWKDLAPFVESHTDAALRAFVQRQTRGRLHPDGVSAPEFLDAPQANKVLEGLKAWLARERAKARATEPAA